MTYHRTHDTMTDGGIYFLFMMPKEGWLSRRTRGLRLLENPCEAHPLMVVAETGKRGCAWSCAEMTHIGPVPISPVMMSHAVRPSFKVRS